MLSRVATSALVVALALLVGSSEGARPSVEQLAQYDFAQFVKDFHKSYGSHEEFELHRKIFETNLAEVIAHNANPNVSWKLGVNQFSDLSDKDMSFYKGIDKQLAYRRRETMKHVLPTADLPHDLPDSVDWRDEGIVTPVKNQGYCGSCWTFAATEALESAVARDTGYLFTLSEQEFVSCVPNPDECGGTGGCSGATMELAFDYAMENGLVSEWAYPYTSYYGDSGNCSIDGSGVPAPVAGITNYTKNPTNSYTDLLTAVATIGPIAITVDASLWKSYDSGIFDGCDQDSPELDHGVLLVGYGTEDGTDYWLVRNSWGPTWGEHGYIRLMRTSYEARRCGVDVNPQDGVGCKDGPSNVTVCGTCGLLYDTSYPTGGFLA